MTKLAQSSRALFDGMDKVQRAQEGSKTNYFSWSLNSLIEDEGYNTRDYESQRVKDKIRAYADGFKRGDVFPPILIKVIDGVRYIRDGYLRTRGARLANSEGAQIDRLPCIDVVGDEAVQDLVILKSNDGLPLLPLERAAVYVRMMAVRGLSVDEISKLDGRSSANIMVFINAYSLPIALKKLINDGSLSLTYAIELYNQHGSKTVEFISSRLAEIESNTQIQSNLTGIGSTKKENRITPKKMEAYTGYRARFTSKLVIEVTNNLRELKDQLSKATKTETGYLVALTAEQVEALNRLTSDVEPKVKKETAADSKELVQASTN